MKDNQNQDEEALFEEWYNQKYRHSMTQPYFPMKEGWLASSERVKRIEKRNEKEYKAMKSMIISQMIMIEHLRVRCGERGKIWAIKKRLMSLRNNFKSFLSLTFKKI
jgi:predicted nucleic acid-binding protein